MISRKNCVENWMAKDFALTLRKLMSGVAEDLPKPPTVANENDLEMSGNEDNQKTKTK